MFAKDPIAEGETIAIWGGKIYTEGDIRHLSLDNPSLLLHPLTVAEGFYIGPAEPGRQPEPADFFNHCCDPNAGVRGQILLVARRLIAPGEEICFDYETTECHGSIGMGFLCQCGAKDCRGVIDGWKWREVEFQRSNRGFMSAYLREKFESLRPAPSP